MVHLSPFSRGLAAVVQRVGALRSSFQIAKQGRWNRSVVPSAKLPSHSTWVSSMASPHAAHGSPWPRAYHPFGHGSRVSRPARIFVRIMARKGGSRRAIFATVHAASSDPEALRYWTKVL